MANREILAVLPATEFLNILQSEKTFLTFTYKGINVNFNFMFTNFSWKLNNFLG